MASKSLTDIAESILKKKGKELYFINLWQGVSKEVGYTEELAKRKISSFYNALMLDVRFISLEKNQWDLRERYAEDTLKIDPEFNLDYDDFEDTEEEEEILEDSYD